MNVSDLVQASRKGRIYADRKKWVEPFKLTNPVEFSEKVDPKLQHATYNNVVDMHSKREIYGFRLPSAKPLPIDPHDVSVINISEGYGVVNGGTKLSKVIKTVNNIPVSQQVLKRAEADARSNNTLIFIKPDAEAYTCDSNEFKARF